MNFKYRIENNEVIITGYSDLSSTEINIPEFMDGLPVIGIDKHAFYGVSPVDRLMVPNSVVNIDEDVFAYSSRLKYINNIEIKDKFCVINNRHVWHNTDILYIKYQICGNYYCEYRDEFRYFIDNIRCLGNFIKI